MKLQYDDSGLHTLTTEILCICLFLMRTHV